MKKVLLIFMATLIISICTSENSPQSVAQLSDESIFSNQSEAQRNITASSSDDGKKEMKVLINFAKIGFEQFQDQFLFCWQSITLILTWLHLSSIILKTQKEDSYPYKRYDNFIYTVFLCWEIYLLSQLWKYYRLGDTTLHYVLQFITFYTLLLIFKGGKRILKGVWLEKIEKKQRYAIFLYIVFSISALILNQDLFRNIILTIYFFVPATFKFFSFCLNRKQRLLQDHFSEVYLHSVYFYINFYFKEGFQQNYGDIFTIMFLGTLYSNILNFLVNCIMGQQFLINMYISFYKLIKGRPKKAVDKDSCIDDSREYCPICYLQMKWNAVVIEFGELSSEKGTIVRTKCNHFYHTTCLKKWMKQKQTCPVDNRPLKWSWTFKW